MTTRHKPLRSHGRRRFPSRRMEQAFPAIFGMTHTLHPTKGWRRVSHRKFNLVKRIASWQNTIGA